MCFHARLLPRSCLCYMLRGRSSSLCLAYAMSSGITVHAVDSGATPAGVKVHLAHSHDCWNDLWPRILELAALMRRAITKPCIYCFRVHF